MQGTYTVESEALATRRALAPSRCYLLASTMILDIAYRPSISILPILDVPQRECNFVMIFSQGQGSLRKRVRARRRR
eukprot:2509335-Pleurochrysis_carterae.AAC.2